MAPGKISERLLAWFDRGKRSLPWRGRSDPYEIWVSEVMLQQTTHGAVSARYERFLARFPNLETLARARLETVLAQWSGLGYYARARNLHRAAKEIRRRHGGRIPRDPAILRQLPGFGPYMAHALPALAWGRYALPMDANVRRVASRLFVAADPAPHLPRLVSRLRPGDSLAAIFDLGQLVCRARDPLCGACPLGRSCLARRSGAVSDFPPRAARKPRQTVHMAAAVLRRGGRVFLERRPSGWLAGLWQFPCEEGATASAARRRLERRFGPLPAEPLGAVRHAIVSRDLRVAAYAVPARQARGKGRWALPSALHRSASPTLTRKLAALVGVSAAM
jgi:A/G-specific adenine glycosylase